VLAFSICATAQADLWTPAQTQKAIAVANAHWPASPCAGREQISWIKSDAMADFAATAYPAQCAVTVAWNQVAQAGTAPAFMCTVLEHEFGHLSGLGHSPDPNNVMFAIVWKPSADCAAAFTVHTKLPQAGIRHTATARTRRVASATQSTSTTRRVT
jgi:hypothetical protein